MSAKKIKRYGYTFNTRSEAKKAGLRALSKMKSKEWKIEVWENIGWHFNLQVIDGLVTIHCNDTRGLHKLEYSCYIDREFSGADGLDEEDEDKGFQWDYSDPQKAFEVKMRLVKKHINGWQKLLNRVEKETKPPFVEQRTGRVVDC